MNEMHITGGGKLNSLANITRPRVQIPTLVDGGERTASGDLSKANMLAKLFSEQCSNDQSYPPVRLNDDHPLFETPNLSEVSVFRALRSLRVYRSVGGEVSNRLLKETAEVITQSLCYLFNLSLSLGEFPDDWKLATVIPLYKHKGNASDPSNYRPISLLPGIGKVLDRLVCRRLTTFLHKHNVITPVQYGFVRNRSTLDQLITLTATAQSALDRNHVYESMFLDFAKAFGRVPHPIILSILKNICTPDAHQETPRVPRKKALPVGISPSKIRITTTTTTTHQWFSSYLYQRRMRVRVEREGSDVYHINAGVPQGSHLGPVLFLLYINTLPRVLDTKHDVLLFADDTLFGCVGTHQATTCNARSELQEGVDKVLAWAKSMGGRFNPMKSVHLTFQKNSPDDTPGCNMLTMNNVLVPSAVAHRHLGVLLDSQLKFQDHITMITSKFRQRVVLLSYMAMHLTDRIVDRLYKGYVRPTIEYASPLWQFKLSSASAMALERLQARVARQLLRCKREVVEKQEHKSDIFKRVGWGSLAWRRHIACLIEFHHIIHNLPAILESFGFSTSSSERRPFFIVLPFCKTKTSFLFATARCWNSLPSLIRKIRSPYKFKLEIKKHFENSKHNTIGFIVRH